MLWLKRKQLRQQDVRAQDEMAPQNKIKFRFVVSPVSFHVSCLSKSLLVLNSRKNFRFRLHWSFFFFFSHSRWCAEFLILFIYLFIYF